MSATIKSRNFQYDASWGHFERLLILMACTIALACAGSSQQKGLGAKRPDVLPPNTAIYYDVSEKQVWDALERTLELDFLMPMSIVNERDGLFATELARDFDERIQVKYRISGSLKYDGTGIVVVLYNERQVLGVDGWQSVPSDYVLEQMILRKVKSRLKN